jgi:hypothetical protein
LFVIQNSICFGKLTDPEPDSVAVKPNNSFYNTLAEKAEKRRWTRELHNIILSKPQNHSNDEIEKATISPYSFASYAGAPIKQIRYKKLDVFGPSVFDTAQQPHLWIQRFCNNLHISTREIFIRNNILFKPGQALDPTTLAENERILRNLPYIEDARIIVNCANDQSDSVIVTVITKDVWGLGFDMNVGNPKEGKFEIWNRNLLGLGQEYQNNINWNSTSKPATGYEGIYKISNIAGSFFSGKLYYNDNYLSKGVGFEFARNFFTPNTKLAGGLSMSHLEIMRLISNDSVIEFKPILFNQYDYWLGRSYSVNNDNFKKTRQNITLSARVHREYFIKRPKVKPTLFYDYQDKMILLNSVSYTRQTYYKSQYIYNFGKTEDIAEGMEFTLTGGLERNEFGLRKYNSIRLNYGIFGHKGYIYSSAEMGSFFTKENNTQQAVYDSKLNYFSPLFIIQRYKIRQFINFRYTLGLNRFENEFVNINGRNGIQGFTNDSILGSQRIRLTWETVFFTPWVLLDFKFVGFIAADHSWIGNSYFKNKLPYTGLHIGFRIRNERLVFKTIQIRFSYYPNIPRGSVTNFANIRGEQSYNAPNFAPTPPTILVYQ